MCSYNVFRSLPADIVRVQLIFEDEVRILVDKGVKEFQIIAQDLSYYGIDRYKEPKLAELDPAIIRY